MKPEKCTKQGMHLFIYYLKENIPHDVINVSLFACCEPRHRRVVCRPVSTLKADILNITYDCYSQNNNVKMATL